MAVSSSRRGEKPRVEFRAEVVHLTRSRSIYIAAMRAVAVGGVEATRDSRQPTGDITQSEWQERRDDRRPKYRDELP